MTTFYLRPNSIVSNPGTWAGTTNIYAEDGACATKNLLAAVGEKAFYPGLPDAGLPSDAIIDNEYVGIKSSAKDAFFVPPIVEFSRTGLTLGTVGTHTTVGGVCCDEVVTDEVEEYSPNWMSVTDLNSASTVITCKVYATNLLAFTYNVCVDAVWIRVVYHVPAPSGALGDGLTFAGVHRPKPRPLLPRIPRPSLGTPRFQARRVA